MKKTSARKLFNTFESWSVDNDNILSMKMTSIGCPLQFEGVLKDGSCFYFRDRHGSASFAVANTVKEAVRANRKEAFFYWAGRGDMWSVQAADKISKMINKYFKTKKEGKKE